MSIPLRQAQRFLSDCIAYSHYSLFTPLLLELYPCDSTLKVEEASEGHPQQQAEASQSQLAEIRFVATEPDA